MGLIIFFILGTLIHLAHSREMQDSETRELVLNPRVTAVLGEEVYLHCLYTGQSGIIFSSWNRLDSSKKARKMAGYREDISFNKENFGIPASLTNLTVKLNVTSLDLQGEYGCVFNSEDDEIKDTVILTVVARPDIDTNVWEEVVNGTLYQTVTCSASSAKPEAVIRWEISGALPRDDVFSVNTTNTIHPNGTNSSASVLHFPFIMNNESTVTCVVEHPAFTEPKRTNIEVNTFVSPVMSMETVLVQEGGEDYQEVTCSATGGRPHPNITWRLPEFKKTPPLQRNHFKPDSVVASYRFPSDPYEGETVSCVFGYTLLPFRTTRTITLPIYYLSSIQLKDLDYAINNENQTSLALEEGDTDVRVRMTVVGNVPSFKISCSRENQPLPQDVDVVGNDLFIRGPVEEHLAGRYLCQASFRKHLFSLEFTIEVKPKVLLPVSFPPNISVNSEENSDYIRIECLASNAVPAANVSWILPQGMKSKVHSDVTSNNESYSVRSVLTAPTCMSREHIIECVVEHPDFMVKERRQVPLPVCAPPNITLQSSIEWDDGIEYAHLVCSVQSQALVAISWVFNCHGIDIDSSGLIMNQTEFQSVTHIPIYSHAGCNVTCAVEQQGLEKPKNESIILPSVAPPNITLQSSIEWDDGIAHAHLVCSVQSQAPVAISWVLNCHGIDINSSGLIMNQTEFQSVTHIPVYSHAGCNVTCAVEQQGLEKPKNESIILPSVGLSSSRAFVYEEEHTNIWHAVCEYSGDGVKPRISWILPDENPAIEITTEAKYDGMKLEVNLTYEFQLSEYEGMDLICVIRELDQEERQTIRVPQYSISSVEVLNKTTQSRRSHGQREHRLQLLENLSNQKILLRAHGNATSYETTCYRDDGSVAHTEDMALVFTRPVSEKDAGLYICQISYLHHMAKVLIRVDVVSEETQHILFIIICFTSASALTLILTVVLLVFCKCGKNHSAPKKSRRERESLAALMQDPRSSERTLSPSQARPQYAELVHYSIVFDAKSTV